MFNPGGVGGEGYMYQNPRLKSRVGYIQPFKGWYGGVKARADELF